MIAHSSTEKGQRQKEDAHACIDQCGAQEMLVHGG